jgi:hypothetical protein
MPTTTVQFPLPQFHYKKVKASNCNPQKISAAAWEYFNKSSPQFKAVYMKIGGPEKLTPMIFAVINSYLPLVVIAQTVFVALCNMYLPVLSPSDQPTVLHIVMGVLSKLA